MSVRTPEPRLPLEPEEYPLYRPPSRIGCSALTVITLITLVTFAFLFSRVTPQMAKAITDLPKSLLSGGDATADTTPGVGAYATQTAQVGQPTVTAPVAANPTPTIEYVQIANTGGQGVKLRAEPRADAKNVVTVGEGATLRVIGSDTTNADGVWRHIQLLPPDGRAGYVLNKYVIGASPPAP
jgi:hypothetical protein